MLKCLQIALLPVCTTQNFLDLMHVLSMCGAKLVVGCRAGRSAIRLCDAGKVSDNLSIFLTGLNEKDLSSLTVLNCTSKTRVPWILTGKLRHTKILFHCFYHTFFTDRQIDKNNLQLFRLASLNNTGTLYVPIHKHIKKQNNNKYRKWQILVHNWIHYHRSNVKRWWCRHNRKPINRSCKNWWRRW